MAFQEHFRAVFAPPDTIPPSAQDLLRDVHEIRDRVLFPNDPPTFREGSFSSDELLKVLATLERGRAPGIDGIPPEVYKLPGLSDVLLPMLNHAYASGSVPAQWRVLIMVPVPKKGDLTVPQNYRGISLMCILAKVYNKLLLFRIRAGLEDKLLPTQNGFRPGRSTVQHIALLRMLCQHALTHAEVSLALTPLSGQSCRSTRHRQLG